MHRASYIVICRCYFAVAKVASYVVMYIWKNLADQEELAMYVCMHSVAVPQPMDNN